jgi:pyruvate dehydrogenase E2 component (dihydrolipoamide acetyltransferase)
MSIAIKMPALSPTMEEGTLAKWLVKVGDKVSAGDIMAEIETDKATMEFEAVDEGTIADISVPEGSEGVKVGTVIATLAEEGEDPKSVKPASDGEAPAAAPAPAEAPAPTPQPVRAELVEAPSSSSSSSAASQEKSGPSTSSGRTDAGGRVIASPLAKRIAAEKGIDLAGVAGSGPHGRIVKADVEGTPAQAGGPGLRAQPTAAPAAAGAQLGEIPHEVEKLSGMRKTIARRLTESKQTIPHIYLTVDIQLDKLLKLRAEINEALASQGVKVSVNDMLIKALARALIAVPVCNVQFAGDNLLKFSRADISVAVSVPGGLITPIVVDAGNKAISAISGEMKDLAERAREHKLSPHEYQGGTASLSNMGMFGIKQFEAVINPPQAMIMAIGAGEKRPYVVDDALSVATVMSATGSFDHRAIDGADGAQLMKVFKDLCEKPLGLVA